MRNYISMKYLILSITIILLIASCSDIVEDGYSIQYNKSDATLSITPLTPVNGAVGDTIKVNINVSAENQIKTFRISPSADGELASGIVLSNGGNDPFIDHNFGTIQSSVYSLNFDYQYIIPESSGLIKISFLLVEGNCKIDTTLRINVLPSVASYQNVAMYTQNSFKADGFSTINGMVYHNLEDYEAITETNRQIQESLDMVFLIENQKAVFASPSYSGLSSNMGTRNTSKFLKLAGLNDSTFTNLTSGAIEQIFIADSVIKNGKNALKNIQKGDYIAILTDFNATNSYKQGIVKVTNLHPTQVEPWEGLSYLIEFSIKVQQTQIVE